jgi:protein TonB
MKSFRRINSLLFLFLLVSIAAQSCKAGMGAKAEPAAKQVQEDPIYSLEEISQSPVYPGTESAFVQYMASLRLPALEEGTEFLETLEASFVIEKDGSTSQIQSLQNQDHPWVKAYIEHLQKMEKWTPAEKGGEPVRVRMVIPMHFRRG